MMDILREALVALNDWVEAGCPEHLVFGKGFAICSNVYCYVGEQIFHDQEYIPWELKNLFRKDGLDSEYPFNEDGEEGFLGSLNAANFGRTPNVSHG